MTSGVSPISESTSANVPQYSAVHNAPPSSKAASNEDTVQLSNETQQHVTSTTASPPPAAPSFHEIIREAADGNIAAIAQLALVG